MKKYQVIIHRVGVVFICAAFTIFSQSGYAAPIDIVKDHQARASIVLPGSATDQEKNAANILQLYIKQSTGATLPITSDGRNSGISIHIGVTPYVSRLNINRKNIDEDGFILRKVDDRNFIIMGGSDWGTEFGVYSFLERYVGVVWLMPTDIGADVPEHQTVTIPDVNVVDSPTFLSRQISPINIDVKNALGTWGRVNRLRGRISFKHNLLNLFDAKEYFKTNPEFFPTVNGRREAPVNYKWQPNFSAPHIADSASQKIIRYFNTNPNIASYSLGINDFRTFDQSAQSLARRSGKKNYLGLEDVSDDYFRWANEVAKQVTAKYPDKKFGLLAYNNVGTPPSESVGVNPSIVPFITYERMRWADPVLKEKGEQLTRDWGKMTKEVGWYDYTYGLNYLVPRVWFHQMKDYLVWGSKNGVKYYYAELYPNWGEGPKPWIQSKLLWNPNQDVDSLLNVWYLRTAGEAAAPKLKDFYALWEKFWTRDIYSSKWNNNNGQYLPFNNFAYLDAVPKDYISLSDNLMNAAAQLAGTPAQKQRVGKLLEMWNIYKTAIQIYQQSNFFRKKDVLSTSTQFISLLNTLKDDPLHSLSIDRIKKEFRLTPNTASKTEDPN